MKLERRQPEAPPSEALSRVLNRRAERLKAERATITDRSETDLWIAEMVVGDEYYAMDLSKVRAALPLRMVTPVPLASPSVIGVLRYQGELITAFSFVSLLGVRGWRMDPEVLVVVETSPGKKIALDCEQIPKATSLPRTLVEEARARSSGPLVEITTTDMRLVRLVDDPATFFEERTHNAH